MKRNMPTMGWMALIACLMLLAWMPASAFGSSGAVRNVEADLGIMLAPASANCNPCQNLDAVVLQPEKLALLGLSGLKKGDTLRLVHQVDNLWRVVDTENGSSIRIRLRLTNGFDGIWPFPTAL
jgi:hypothetical protein